MGWSSVLPPSRLVYIHASRLAGTRSSLLLLFDRNVGTFAGADRGDRLQGEAGLHRRGRHHGAQLPLL